MATPTCTMCEQEAGVIITSIIADGDTTIVGPQCLAGYALELASAVTRKLPDGAGDAYGQLFDAIAANDPRKPAPAAPAAARSRKPKADPPMGAALGGPETTAAPDPSPSTPEQPEAGSVAPVAAQVALTEPCKACGHDTGVATDAGVTCASCGAPYGDQPADAE